MSTAPKFSAEPMNDDLLARAQLAGARTEILRTQVTEMLRKDFSEATPQIVTHGYAWLCAYAEAVKQGVDYFRKLREAGKAGRLEENLFAIGMSEFIRRLAFGIPMNQTEIVRPYDFPGCARYFTDFAAAPEVAAFLQAPDRVERAAVTAEMIANNAGAPASGVADEDETIALLREQFHRFSRDKVAPFAHEWHMKDVLIPQNLIDEMAALGAFGLTISENYGGSAMGKTAMCVMSEELSCGYIGVGSLGTRTEIAAELILHGGTQTQKDKYLPGLASGTILPTAVFTEPNTGSDLGSLKTRAVRDGDIYRITGAKTWITHAVRADLMTVLARTDPNAKDWRGLSMFLAEKPRGTDSAPFPINGLKGGEIPVLGYRGMKEYELAFDNFEVPASALLGEVEGSGFKHLMKTFESARVQTAARALGVAQNALDLAVKYATQRVQFGQPIIKFGRTAEKISLMAAEMFFIRALTMFAAESVDTGKRCDTEAGMAKLTAAALAWSAADNALQIHGGNGFATEYEISRVLCDARILNIFEGAAEIQAEVVAKRLLG